MTIESGEQSSVHVDSFRPEDAGEVTRLRLDARRTDPHIFPTSYENEAAKTPEERQLWFDDTAGENPVHIIVLGKCGMNVAGMMGARDKGNGTWYLHGVYVRPEFRGRHIGEKMLQAIVGRIRERPGARIITFQVEAENIPAMEMYKKYGFEIVGDDHEVMGDGKEHSKYVLSLLVQDIKI